MNESYHPWLSALLAEARPDAVGALCLPSATVERAKRELAGLAPAESQLRAVHLVAFAQALFQRHGDAVLALLEQLTLLAAVAISDPRALRDALEHAGFDQQAAQRLLGRLPSATPEKAATGGISLLELRAGATRKE